MGKTMITRADATYLNGFPADLDIDGSIIVQVTEKPMQSIVLYCSKHTGKPTRSYFGFDFSDKYYLGIFEL